MSLRLERAFSKSKAYGPSEYWNQDSPTLTRRSGVNQDAEGRIACNFENFWIEETQTTDATDLMATYIAPLGDLGRWYLQVRGAGDLAFYRSGVQVTTPVSFDTTDLWWLIDVGDDVVRGFTETLSIRVWGASTIKTGALFFCHRPLIYNAVDVLVASPPNTTTVSDPGSIAATVARYYQTDRSDPPEQIMAVTPNLSPTEALVPLQIGRTTGGTVGSDDDSGDADYEESTSKNGTRFGITNTAATSFSGSLYRRTPVVSQVNQGTGGYPPGASNPGSTPTRYSASFDTDDVLGIYAARMSTADANPEPQDALIDQIVLVRDCAQDFFDALNSGHTSSFAYSWSSPDGAPVDHYAIVVTDQTGDATLGDGTVLQTIDPATSPETVTGLAGSVRVYLLPVTADGAFGCFDFDEFTVASAGQILRYR